MRGYGLPNHLDDADPDEVLIETYGLKNRHSYEKRNASKKRAIRKAQKHSERFQTKRRIQRVLNSI